METRTRETLNEPPAPLKAVVEMLTPHAYREDVVGDLLQRYVSAPLFIYDAARSIAKLVAGLVRDSFNPAFAAGQALAVFVSFSEIPISLRLVPVLLACLGGLVLRDAYTYPERQLPHDAGAASASAVLFLLVSQAFLGLVAPVLALPAATMWRGAAIMVLTVSAWRMLFAGQHPGNMPGDDRRRRAIRSYRNTWLLNALWMIACMVLMLTNPHTGHDFLIGMLPPVLMAVAFASRSQRTHLDVNRHTPRSLLVAADPRIEIARQRNNLWNTATASPWGDGAESIFFLVLAYPLLTAVSSWLAGMPGIVDWFRLATNFVAISALAVLWALIRKFNRTAVNALQAQLDALHD